MRTECDRLLIRLGLPLREGSVNHNDRSGRTLAFAAHFVPLILLGDFAAHSMTHIIPKEIVEFVRSQGELHLSTLAQKRPFVVRVFDDTLEFTPSSEKPRSRDRESLVRVCDEFSRTNSLHPGDYANLSVHASYTLAVIDAYLKSK
ncbi:MAG: hypothetical protein KIS67_21690 [Verrucomicrobiae bacterium]|nr:hypothetical protein [Verrucomicrobiae bacterium]